VAAFQKAWDEHAQKYQRTTYDEIQEYRKRGESRVIGHYAYEMMYDVYVGIEDE
jgi:hypothetical protein